MDPDVDDGPFFSDVYLAGSFQLVEAQIVFTPNSNPVRLFHFPYNKVEALELVPGAQGGLVCATDDENFGSSVYLDW